MRRLTRLISPVLMNVALHGLEQPARTRYFANDRKDAGNRFREPLWW